jgi:hypothetical protein
VGDQEDPIVLADIQEVDDQTPEAEEEGYESNLEEAIQWPKILSRIGLNFKGKSKLTSLNTARNFHYPNSTNALSFQISSLCT